MIVLLLTDYVRDDCLLGVRGSSGSKCNSNGRWSEARTWSEWQLGMWRMQKCEFPKTVSLLHHTKCGPFVVLETLQEKMAEQREQGGNFHYECRLHGGDPLWSYLKWVGCRMRAHHALVSILVARGYVTLYESLAMSFRILSRLTHPQESRIRKYVNLLTEYAFTWWHSYILICTCCEVSMTAVGSGGNLWIAYMMEVMVDTLWLNSHGYYCTFSAAKVLVWLALMQSASTSL